MDINLRVATEEEALDILRDKSVLPYLSVYPEGIKEFEKYILGEKALLIVMPKKEIAEVHIACRRKDRVDLRIHLLKGLEWLKLRGFKKVETTAPEDRTALKNMLESLGFEQSNNVWSYKWV